MTLLVNAVYEGGVFRPMTPVELPEGTRVDLTFTTAPQDATHGSLSPQEQEYASRVRAAHSIEELFAAMASAPPLPQGYDLLEALNSNRDANGERPLFANGEQGTSL